MKKRLFSMFMVSLMAGAMMIGCGDKTTDGKDAKTEVASDAQTYKVGIIQYVDDASLNQIVDSLEKQLDVLAEEKGVTFEYEDYYCNGQADSTTINQMVSELINDEVDILVPIATPTAMICQAATEDNQIPVVFAAVSDPEGAGLVASNDAPGSNVTGTSDALNTEAVLDLMIEQDRDLSKVGLLYDKSQDASAAPIAAAKEYLDAKGIDYVEKTGTTNDEVMLAADALIAADVEAVFTPTDNTIMTAELGIYEKFIEAGIPHYCGADSFALNGAYLGYGVNYATLGTETANMVAEILVDGKDPATLPVKVLDNGTATVNTDTAEALGLDYEKLRDLCDGFVEIQTAEEFE
ncbi:MULTISPECIES: ABC transporter substrate-binding protein [Pseudobutyrivibrio]|jgi:putative ABC transport system substrate-binding protein|uniref:ABC transporter n=1 Tax=Pseudobutyrivibrio ruminis TaxID=46206 RepID=A0A2G3DXI2_9FIRM|nr:MULTISPECIES: ABC transporter substrate-binding protein [Pseudobutyrivibrio]MBE5904755.1 ABC transporter [Pseudobutyrivibrio sp.]PHU35709.1 ABC transporter [Pseudobutyrivibrio ruminis]SCY38160.1 putative ABC transport system substrate-binding protein [Pseudobutyrivibrio sp. AR14]